MKIVKIFFLSIPILALTACCSNEPKPVQPTSTDIKVFFTPSTDCEKQVIDAINEAQKIDIAVYSITNPYITDAIINAYNRGANIRIVTDRTQAKGKGSLIKRIHLAGIPVLTNKKHKIEHNKFAIYDKIQGSTGSFNWTNPAQNMNSENCLFFDDKETTDEYLTHFEYLWKINTSEKSQDWIESHFE